MLPGLTTELLSWTEVARWERGDGGKKSGEPKERKEKKKQKKGDNGGRSGEGAEPVELSPSKLAHTDVRIS